MIVEALEVNISNPKVAARVKKLAKLLDLNDGSKLTAREISDTEVIEPGLLSGYDLRVFQRDEPNIFYCVFSFDTPIAWVVEDESEIGKVSDLRFITGGPITQTSERHRDVVRRAWMVTS